MLGVWTTQAGMWCGGKGKPGDLATHHPKNQNFKKRSIPIDETLA
jgi:hypothetical protein